MRAGMRALTVVVTGATWWRPPALQLLRTFNFDALPHVAILVITGHGSTCKELSTTDHSADHTDDPDTDSCRLPAE